MAKRRNPIAPPPEAPLPVLEDWTPLGRCLEARIAQAAWLEDGGRLLLDGTLPVAGHDSGTLASRAARLLAAWCEERTAAGDLPETIIVVELGIGTGGHLRGLLGAFRRLCVTNQRDWYGRLQVFATDASPSVLELATQRQVFAADGPRVRLGAMDARAPGLFAEWQTQQRFDLRGQVHVLLANYVLDTLPVDIYRADSDGWQVAAVRTVVPDPAQWQAATGLDLVTGQQLAADPSLEAAWRLAPGQLQTRLEVRTLPFALAEHPDGDELARAAAAQVHALGPGHPLLADGTVLHHPVGAMQVLPLWRDALAASGFAVLRDVGLTTPELSAESRLPQRFGRALAMPLDFVQLDGWMAAAHPQTVWLVPPHDGARNHGVRLLARAPLPVTALAFAELYDAQALDRGRQLARVAAESPDVTARLEAWRQAALAEPDDWLILQEAAAAALDAGQAGLALAIAARGLELNPVTSPDLWRLAGTAHALAGEMAAAEVALRQGLAIAPDDAGLHVTLARLAVETGAWSVALRHLGAALAGPGQGTWRQTALALLNTTLDAQARQQAQTDSGWQSRWQ